MSKLLKKSSFLVVLILILNLIPLQSSQAAWVDSFELGASRLADLQNNDGGWDWPLDNGDKNTGSAANTVGPIAMGLAIAYQETGNTEYLPYLQQAGQFLLNKTNNFSPSDGYLAVKLDQALGESQYTNHVMTYFYNELANGNYDRNGAGTLYTTTDYIARIQRIRSGVSANLAAWDIGMGLVAASMAGANTSPWIIAVKEEINELEVTNDNYYDVIGLAGALYGLAYVAEDFDPTTGEHQDAANLEDLADILASYQLDSGGFTWKSTARAVGDETIQETAYAMLALHQVDPVKYKTAIRKAATYLRKVQLENGGWESYAGGNENNEITGEALWGLSIEDFTIPTIMSSTNTIPANGSILKLGANQIKIEFNDQMLADGSIDAVDSADNYLLVEAGVNGVFDTTSCAVPGSGAFVPDDIKIGIDSVSYDNSGPYIATLNINGGLPLINGNYRIYICGTTSIHDIYGIKLNDGAADSLIEFTVNIPSGGTSANSTLAEDVFTLPTTGFPLGVQTSLPPQSKELAYAPTDLVLNIPKFGINMSVVGVPITDDGWDTTWLGQNAGWLNGSAFPTWEGNTVITGHVWDSTNLPGPFANVKNLIYGDSVQILYNNQTYTYQVVSNELISVNQVRNVFSHEDYNALTLLTCENYSILNEEYTNRRMVKAILISVE